MRFTFFILFLLLVSCNYLIPQQSKVSAAIGKQVRLKGVQVIDLATVVPFEWSHLYLFAPYSSPASICKDMNNIIEKCSEVITQESTSNADMILLFLLNDKVVHQELHNRFNGDFLPIEYPMPVRYERAKYQVIDAGFLSNNGDKWLKLAPIGMIEG